MSDSNPNDLTVKAVISADDSIFNAVTKRVAKEWNGFTQDLTRTAIASAAVMQNPTRAVRNLGDAFDSMAVKGYKAVTAQGAVTSAVEKGTKALTGFAASALKAIPALHGLAAAEKDAADNGKHLAGAGGLIRDAFAQFGGMILHDGAAKLTEWGKAAFENSVQLDRMHRSLTAVMGSASAANTEQRNLFDIGKLPGIGRMEALQGSIALQSSGFTAKTSRNLIRGIGNAISISGGTKEDSNQIFQEIQEIVGRGSVDQRNLQVIKSRAPIISRALQGEFGTTSAAGLQAKGVTPEQFVNGLIKGLDKLPKATSSVQNDIDNFKDSASAALAKVGNAFIPIAEKGIQTIVPLFDKIAASAEKLGPLVGPALAGVQKYFGQIAKESGPELMQFFQQGGVFLKDFIRIIGPVLADALKGTIKFLADFLHFVGPSLFSALTVATQILADLVRFVLNTGKAISDAWTKDVGGLRSTTESILSGIWKIFTDIFGGIVDWVKENLPLIKETIKTILDGISALWKRYGGDIMAVVKGTWNIIVTVVRVALVAVGDIIRIVMDIITGHWKDAWQTLGKLVNTVLDGIDSVLRNAWPVIVGLVKAIFTGILDLTGWVFKTAYDLGKGLIDAMADGVKGSAASVASESNKAAQAGLREQEAANRAALLKQKEHAGDMATVTKAAAVDASAAAKKQAADTAALDKKQADEAAKVAKGKTKEQEAEEKKQVSSEKRFVEALKSARSELRAAQKDGDKSDDETAKRFPRIAEGRRNVLSAIMAQISGLTDYKKALEEAEKAELKSKFGENSLPFLRNQFPGASDKNLKNLLNIKEITKAGEVLKETGKKVAQAITEAKTEVIKALFGENSIQALRREFPGIPDKTLEQIRAYRFELKSLAKDAADAATGFKTDVGTFASIDLTPLTKQIKEDKGWHQTQDAIGEVNKQILLLKQTTTEGTLAVQMFGKAFADLNPDLKVAVKDLADATDKFNLKQGDKEAAQTYDDFFANKRKSDEEKANQKRAAFVKGFADEASKQSRGFFDALLSGKTTVHEFWQNLVAEGKKSLVNMAWDALMKPQIERLFTNLGNSVQDVLTTTLKTTEASVYKMLGAAYSIYQAIAASMQGNNGGLLGALAGGLLGLAFGGPAGALLGAQIGAAAGPAIASGDFAGAILSGGLAYVGATGGAGLHSGAGFVPDGTAPVSGAIHSPGAFGGGKLGKAQAITNTGTSRAQQNNLSVYINTINDRADARRVVNTLAQKMQIGSVSPALI